MPPDRPPPGPGRDLPPVQPPSGRFIAQLFLVPGLIVLAVVLLVLAINYLFVGGNSPQQFLARIDSDNPDIRWRGANDLAQVLLRKESAALKTDVDFALGIVVRLHDALEELIRKEKAIAGQVEGAKDDLSGKAFRRLEPQRNLVEFLANALGEFSVPVGVPVLCEMVDRDDSPDILHQTMRRRKAVWALAKLGELTRAFVDDKRAVPAAVAKLEAEADAKDDLRRKTVRTALFYLGDRKNGEDVVRVDAALAKAAGADDRFLREQVAFAFNFWDGPLAEPTLLRLARDDGFGTELRTPEEP